MGLFKASIISVSLYLTIKAIQMNHTIVSKLPLISTLFENKINYCYLLLIIVFIFELLL